HTEQLRRFSRCGVMRRGWFRIEHAPVRGLATQSAHGKPRRPNARTLIIGSEQGMLDNAHGFLSPCRRAVDPFHINVRAVRILVLLVLHGSRAVFGRSWRIAPGPSR